MGWYGDQISRSEKVRQLTNSKGSKCLAHCYRGGIFKGVLWSVWENSSGKFIVCDLLEYRSGMWWHKPLEESMGPLYYSCPKKYLEMAPVVNEEWRENVRKYHFQKALTRKPKRGKIKA